MTAKYLIRPKADEDLENQAYYLATQATPEIGHRFLTALTRLSLYWPLNRGMGSQVRLPRKDLKSLRIFPVSGFRKILVFYQPISEGIEVLRVLHGSRNIRLLLRREGLE